MNHPLPAYIDGWLAHKNGVKYSNMNPHNEKSQNFSFRAWKQGWSARYDAVKRGLPLTLDKSLEDFICQQDSST